MHITLSVMQFFSIVLGTSLLCYFWGSWVERRHIKEQIAEGVRDAFKY